MRCGRWLGAQALACVLSSCVDDPGRQALELLDIRPRELGSVALNEELVFYFSDDLDRTSITSDSLRILDDRGHPVAGERSVRANALTFLPALPCASDLSDGGFRPGSRYRVALGGFPRPDGIRSESGVLLSASLQLSFRTAEIGGAGPLFLDPFHDSAVLTPRVEGGEILLECAEALDPSRVPLARFWLSTLGPGRAELELSARLVQNLRTRALLRLEPKHSDSTPSGGLPPGRYFLRPQGRELCSLGGREVETGWEPLRPLIVPPRRIEVDLGAPGGRSARAPERCAGTAHWSEEEGALVVRYPRAAGSGGAGEVELLTAPSGNDLHATHILVPADGMVDLSSFRGPVVLRSQTSIDILGRLSRRGRGQEPKDPLTPELEKFSGYPEADWPPLSTWIEDLLANEQLDNQPWTILIAGGDIRIPRGGSIDVEGPLVLVAGGWIRAESNVVAQGDLWKTREGGGSSRSRLLVLPLRLDPPERNPLRTFLSVGVVTHPMPWPGAGRGWRTLLNGSEGSGRLSLLFQQEGGTGWSSDPGSLSAGEARVLVRFEMTPGRGEPWAPPRCERVVMEPIFGSPVAGSPR